MAYRPLDEHTVLDYARSQPQLAQRLGDCTALTAEEVGDGNLNLVFIVRNGGASGESAIIKQSLPYLRVAGDSWPLTRERMRFEAQALLLYNQLAPGLSPEVYLYDPEMSLVG